MGKRGKRKKRVVEGRLTRRGEEEKRRKRRGRNDEERKGPRKQENVVLIGERKNIQYIK